VQLRVRDVAHGDRIAARAIVMQQKTQRPVQFEITEPTRKAVFAWIRHAALKTEDYLFLSRLRLSPHLSTRQYARIGRLTQILQTAFSDQSTGQGMAVVNNIALQESKALILAQSRGGYFLCRRN
jgi:hypothetical protein